MPKYHPQRFHSECEALALTTLWTDLTDTKQTIPFPLPKEKIGRESSDKPYTPLSPPPTPYEILIKWSGKFLTLRNHLKTNIIQAKKGKRKVQGEPQSQTAAFPRPQEEEETDKSKQAQTEQTYEKH